MAREPSVLLLKDANPEILGEWHPSLNEGIDPRTVTASSNRKVFWLGQCGHEWDAVVASRTRLGASQITHCRRLLIPLHGIQRNVRKVEADLGKNV